MSEPSDAPASDAGTAGASARREHERRRARREQRVRERHPRIGGALLALSDAPQHEESWARGAAGEERVARVLGERVPDSVVLLHDRRIPGSRANIDHLAVTPGAVWVIDTKCYKGGVKVSRPLLAQAKLLIAGRDKTSLVEGVERQAELVRATLAGQGVSAPVHAVLCFVDADLPLLGTLRFRDVLLLSPKALAKRLGADGDASTESVRAQSALLAEVFPPA